MRWFCVTLVQSSHFILGIVGVCVLQKVLTVRVRLVEISLLCPCAPVCRCKSCRNLLIWCISLLFLDARLVLFHRIHVFVRDLEFSFHLS